MTLTINLANTRVNIRFLGDAHKVVPLYRSLYGPFVGNGHQAEAELDISFVPYSMTELSQNGKTKRNPIRETIIPNDQAISWLENKIENPDSIRMNEYTKSVRYKNGLLIHTAGEKTGRLYLSSKDMEPFRSLYHLLWVYLAQALGENKACFLHAAGLEKNKKGYVFIGGSGAGKTTLAKLCGNSRVLSDEAPILFMGRSNYQISPSPFNQIVPMAMLENADLELNVPLRGISFLRRDHRTFIEKLTAGKGLSMILRRHIHFFPYLSTPAKAKLFDLFHGACHKIPISRLHFSKDEDIFGHLPLKEGSYSHERSKG